jgi:mono/diheme cytochrome c family protein
MSTGKRTLIIATVITFLIGGLAGYWLSGRGFSAKEQPSNVEEFLAKRVRALAMPADAKARANPLPLSVENLKAARSHWAEHCAACHALDGSGEADLGKNMYPKAPDMRQPGTQQLSDGEIFYIIQNGIRFTGMPAWASEHSDEDSWRLVHWIRHIPRLTSDEMQEMQRETRGEAGLGTVKPHVHPPGTKPHKD